MRTKYAVVVVVAVLSSLSLLFGFVIATRYKSFIRNYNDSKSTKTRSSYNNTIEINARAIIFSTNN